MALRPQDVYRAAIRWNLDDQICYNILHFEYTGAAVASPAQVNSAFNQPLGAIETFVGSSGIGPVSHDLVRFEEVVMTGVRWVDDNYFRARVLGVDGGFSTAEHLPGFIALPIYLNTGQAGRTRRGRFHWGGINEDYTEGGRLNAAGQAAADTVRAALNAMRVLTSWQMVVWSRVIAEGREVSEKYPEGVPPNPGDASRPVESYSNTTLVGSMYSRRIGIGS